MSACRTQNGSDQDGDESNKIKLPVNNDSNQTRNWCKSMA